MLNFKTTSTLRHALFCSDIGWSKDARRSALCLAVSVSLAACSGGVANAPPTQVLAGEPVEAAPADPSPAPAPSGDSAKPTVSITSPAAIATVSGTVTITAAASDNVGVAGVQFKVNGANAGTEDTSSPYAVTVNTATYANGAYTLAAAARDAAGNTSTSTPVTVTVKNGTPPTTDTNPPSVPTGLTANAVASFQVNLSWSKSTDNVGVAGYKVYRNGSEIATVTQVSHTVTGLAAQKSYTFEVSAFDTAGNSSAKSTGVSATTLAATVGTSLSDLAVQLKPGEWGELATNNINVALGETSGKTATGDIIPYAEGVVWDPVSRQVLFIGSDHNYYKESYISRRFVSYSDATNSWTIRSNPPWFQPSGGHAYDHNAIDPIGREFYHYDYLTTTIHRYNIDTNAWSTLPRVPTTLYLPLSSITYVPELQGMFFVDTYGSAFLFSRSTGSWSSLGKWSGLDYHNFAEYNPVHKVVLFGGGSGSSKLYKLSASGVITPLNDAPLVLEVARMELTADPVSGDFLVLSQDGTFRAYDVTTDSWRTLPSAPASVRDRADKPEMHVVATPIDTYGVVMYVSCDGPDCRVNIYKHTAS